MDGDQARRMAYSWAMEIADWMPRQVIAAPKITVTESGNVDGGWIIEVEFADDATLNIELVAGPVDE